MSNVLVGLLALGMGLALAVFRRSAARDTIEMNTMLFGWLPWFKRVTVRRHYEIAFGLGGLLSAFIGIAILLGFW